MGPLLYIQWHMINNAYILKASTNKQINDYRVKGTLRGEVEPINKFIHSLIDLGLFELCFCHLQIRVFTSSKYQLHIEQYIPGTILKRRVKMYFSQYVAHACDPSYLVG